MSGMKVQTDLSLEHHSDEPAAAKAGGPERMRHGARVRESSETRAAVLRRLQRQRRLSKLRGLSAKRLSERRRRLRQAGLGQERTAAASTIK